MSAPPTPINSSASSAAKRPIDLSAALSSALRTWLVYRDNALWVFCAGTDDSVVPIDAVQLDDAATAVEEMNRLRSLILRIATQIAESGDDRPTRVIIRDACTELLSTESPKFLLSIPYLPGSF